MVPTQLPPGPTTPRLLQMIQWIRDPVQYMESAHQAWGDLFTAQVGSQIKQLVFVSHPEAIRQILTQDTKTFSAPAATNRLLEPIIGSGSVILQEGRSHRRKRQLLMPPFHGERLRVYGQRICGATHQIMGSLCQHQTFTARTTVQRIFLEITMDIIFGLSGPTSDHRAQRQHQLRQKLTAMVNLADSLWVSAALFFPVLQQPWAAWGVFRRLQAQIDHLLQAEIADRRAHLDPQAEDVLSLLLTATDEAGEGLTNAELRDELITLLIAGLENTSSSLAWALYWVHHHPQIKIRLRQELESAGDHPDPLPLSRSPYLNAVIQETLRIYPPAFVAFPRRVEMPVSLCGHDLKPGTPLLICIYLCHHRADLYPEPQRFLPERFLDRQYTPFEYLPYGGGARRCIGDALAQLELKLTLATLISSYDLQLLETQPVQPRRRGVTLAPAGGVSMQLRGRRRRSDRVEPTVASV